MKPGSPPRAPLLPLAIAAVLATWVAAAGAPAATPGCASFRSQANAQRYFVAQGGGPRHQVGALDGDHDGVACEGLSGPYEGFATVGYNRRRGFFYGTASMPPEGAGDGYACLYGNRHFADGPRLLTLFRVRPGADLAIRSEVATEARPDSGRLVWRVDKGGDRVVTGRYYAVFEERVPLSPYGRNLCPGFRSGEFSLP